MLDLYAPGIPSDYDPKVGVLLCHLKGERDALDDVISLVADCKEFVGKLDEPASSGALLSGALAILGDIYEEISLRIREAEKSRPQEAAPGLCPA